MKFNKILWNPTKCYEIQQNVMKFNKMLWNSTKFYEVSWHLMKFHGINYALSYLALFHNLLFFLSMILKVFVKILVSFGRFQIWEILDLAMAKDEKVIIAVTYYELTWVERITLLPLQVGSLSNLWILD